MTGRWSILKELVDNAIDACEEAGIAPEIDGEGRRDRHHDRATTAPGCRPRPIKAVLDFTVRSLRREAYVTPTRGAQGNALKTIVAMPFVLDGDSGRVEIDAHGVITGSLRVDRIAPGTGDRAPTETLPK